MKHLLTIPLMLLASTANAATIERLYLQRPDEDGLVVRWRTDTPTDSILCWDTGPTTTQCMTDSSLTTEHEMALECLAPGQFIDYAVSDASGVLADGPDTHYAVPDGVVTLWALGDSGTGTQAARDVYEAAMAHPWAPGIDAILALGDNAYSNPCGPDGSQGSADCAIFSMYPELLQRAVWMPAIANHDGVLSDPEFLTGPFYDMWSMPGEDQLVPWYSYDIGNVHIVVLPSTEMANDPGDAMYGWLENDLATHSYDWLIAYWHHPLYSFNSHISDDDAMSIRLRQYALPILEAYDVDLTMAGHSHGLERTALIDGHHGHSDEFDPLLHVIDGGDGLPYCKEPNSMNSGAVHAVYGHGGRNCPPAPYGHPAVIVESDIRGSVLIRIDGLVMEVHAIDINFDGDMGDVVDRFTISKECALPGTTTTTTGGETSSSTGGESSTDESTSSSTGGESSTESSSESTTGEPGTTESTGGGEVVGYRSHMLSTTIVNSTTHDLAPAPDAQPGDLLIAHLCADGNTTLSCPLDWSQEATATFGTRVTGVVCSRVATDSEPSSYLYTTTNGQHAHGGIVAFTGGQVVGTSEHLEKTTSPISPPGTPGDLSLRFMCADGGEVVPGQGYPAGTTGLWLGSTEQVPGGSVTSGAALSSDAGEVEWTNALLIQQQSIGFTITVSGI